MVFLSVFRIHANLRLKLTVQIRPVQEHGPGNGGTMRDEVNGVHFRLRLLLPELRLTTFRSKTAPQF